MSLILNIETATKNCSVSLSKDGDVLFFREIAEAGYSHAEKLHVFIEEVLLQSKHSYSELSAVAVSQGPGSYTGLRIGVSAAKGLCYALDIPMIAVDTLAILAEQVQIEEGFIVPMIDARRMEVYSAIFNAKKEMIREVQAEILTDSSFSDIEDAVYFVGDSNEKAKTILSKSNFNFVDTIFYPSAQEMSAISYKKFLNNSFEDVAYFEPYYLKDFMLQTKST